MFADLELNKWIQIIHFNITVGDMNDPASTGPPDLWSVSPGNSPESDLLLKVKHNRCTMNGEMVCSYCAEGSCELLCGDGSCPFVICGRDGCIPAVWGSEGYVPATVEEISWGTIKAGLPE